MRDGQRRVGHVRISIAAALCMCLTGCLAGRRAAHDDGMLAMPPPGTVPNELTKVTLPPYIIETPDVVLIDVYLPPDKPGQSAKALFPQAITGPHMVKMDGTVNLGIWGSLPIAGLTVEQAAEAVRKHVFERIQHDPEIRMQNPLARAEALYTIVDVAQFNSKAYYVFTDGAGYGEQIYRMTYTGNETVLDALSQIGGIPQVGSKHSIWVARRSPHPGHPEQILPVDYVSASQHGVAMTNWQILPGDRVYVHSERIFRVDTWLAKVLSPVERVFGITLLGASTVNEINGRTTSGTTGR
jgi:polysaccharide biosynthesis/export protein